MDGGVTDSSSTAGGSVLWLCWVASGIVGGDGIGGCDVGEVGKFDEFWIGREFEGGEKSDSIRVARRDT